MADLKINCPFCHTVLDIPDDWIDSDVDCPICKKSFTATLPPQESVAEEEEVLLLTPKSNQVQPQPVNAIPPQAIPQPPQQPQQPPPQQPPLPRAVSQSQWNPQQVNYAPQYPPQPPPPQNYYVPRPGMNQMPPKNSKSKSIFANPVFIAIAVSLLIISGGIFAIYAFHDDTSSSSSGGSLTIAEEKRRNQETRDQLLSDYILATVARAKNAKTYDESFTILDRLIKDHPTHSKIADARKLLTQYENECACIIFNANTSDERFCLIFDYSPELEKKFMNTKGCFNELRELPSKQQQMRRQHSEQLVNTFSQDVKNNFMNAIKDLDKLIDGKKYRFYKRYSAKRFTVNNVTPGQYIWCVIDLKATKFWWGKPNKAARARVNYNLD